MVTLSLDRRHTALLIADFNATIMGSVAKNQKQHFRVR